MNLFALTPVIHPKQMLNYPPSTKPAVLLWSLLKKRFTQKTHWQWFRSLFLLGLLLPAIYNVGLRFLISKFNVQFPGYRIRPCPNLQISCFFDTHLGWASVKCCTYIYFCHHLCFMNDWQSRFEVKLRRCTFLIFNFKQKQNSKRGGRWREIYSLAS